MMKNPLKLSQLSLIALPRTRMGNEDARRRGIIHLGTTTASKAVEACGIDPLGHTMFIGKDGRVFPILKQLVNRSGLPYVMVREKGELANSCLKSLEHEWEIDICQSNIPEGNGIIYINGTAEEDLILKEECLPCWRKNRLIILCLGAIRLDAEMADILAPASFMLITNSLHRSTRVADINLSPAELASEMDYIVCSGSSPREIPGILPKYDCEKASNTSDLSLHDGSSRYSDSRYRRSGMGFRLSQSRTIEEKPVLSHGELMSLMENGFSLFYNAVSNRVCTAKIVR